MVRINLSNEVSKGQTNYQILKAVFLKTIHHLYSDNEWFHMFTGDSMLTDCIKAGPHIFCRYFAFYVFFGLVKRL